MDDRQRVRLFERIADLDADADHALRREDRLVGEHGVEREAGDELHHEIEHTVGCLAEVEDRDRVRMRQPTRELCLAKESLDHVRIGRPPRADHLDRDLAVHGVLLGAIHHPHAAASDPLEDRVATVELATDERILLPEPHETPAIVGAILDVRERLLAAGTVHLTRRLRVAKLRRHETTTVPS